MCDMFGISRSGYEKDWRAEWTDLAAQHWVQKSFVARVYGLSAVKGFGNVADGTLAGAMEVTEGLCDYAVNAAQQLNGTGPHRLLSRLGIRGTLDLPTLPGSPWGGLFRNIPIIGQKTAFCYISAQILEVADILIALKILNDRVNKCDPIFVEAGGKIFGRPTYSNSLFVAKMVVDNHEAGRQLQQEALRIVGVNHAIMFVQE